SDGPGQSIVGNAARAASGRRGMRGSRAALGRRVRSRRFSWHRLRGGWPDRTSRPSRPRARLRCRDLTRRDGEAITVFRRRCGLRGSFLALATLAALSAGCVRKDVRGGQTVYRYEPVAWIALAAGGAGLPLLSLRAHRRLAHVPLVGRYTFPGMILPPIAALAFVPTMVRDRIRVDDHGFVSVGGSLIERKVQAVAF